MVDWMCAHCHERVAVASPLQALEARCPHCATRLAEKPVPERPDWCEAARPERPEWLASAIGAVVGVSLMMLIGQSGTHAEDFSWWLQPLASVEGQAALLRAAWLATLGGAGLLGWKAAKWLA